MGGEEARAASGFEERARATRATPDLTRLFADAVKPYGFVVYALGHLTGLGRPSTIYLSTWTRAWTELYAVNGFIGDDPVVSESLATCEPFTWDEVRARRGVTANRVFEAAAEFGWHDGFVVPIHGPGEARGLVALLAGQMRMTAAGRAEVVALSRCVYPLARRLHERTGQSNVTLSPRERAALALVAEGLDDTAIAVALGITLSSAHVYVERAKRRFGASTRAQAVAMALSAGCL